MGLTCGCDSDWYPDPGEWFWNGADEDLEYVPLAFKKRKKCCSCSEMIEIGAPALEHTRVKVPETEVELRIYGDEGEISLASDWMCERCGDLYFSLAELGYCVNPRDDMRELVKEYAREHQANKSELEGEAA